MGARPPARNNNAAEVKWQSGARPAAGDVSTQRAPRSGPGGLGDRGIPAGSAGLERQGAAGAVPLITRCRPGNCTSLNICLAVR